ELGPFMPTRFVVVASIFCAAGTASAGSPRVSTVTHCTWCPSTPDLLIRCAATTQPACISGPKLASGPVKGLKLAKVNMPEYDFGVADCAEEPHAEATRRAPRTNPTARTQRVLSDKIASAEYRGAREACQQTRPNGRGARG